MCACPCNSSVGATPILSVSTTSPLALITTGSTSSTEPTLAATISNLVTSDSVSQNLPASDSESLRHLTSASLPSTTQAAPTTASSTSSSTFLSSPSGPSTTFISLTADSHNKPPVTITDATTTLTVIPSAAAPSLGPFTATSSLSAASTQLFTTPASSSFLIVSTSLLSTASASPKNISTSTSTALPSSTDQDDGPDTLFGTG